MSHKKYCEFCGEPLVADAGPSGFFVGCQTMDVKRQHDRSAYCKGFVEFHRVSQERAKEVFDA